MGKPKPSTPGPKSLGIGRVLTGLGFRVLRGFAGPRRLGGVGV